MSYQYLKSRQYYEDLYDLRTVKRCLEEIEFWRGIAEKGKTDPRAKEIPQEEFSKGLRMYSNLQLMAVKASRYKERASTIQKLIDDDTIKQDKFDSTLPPQNVSCPKCDTSMVLEDFKHLEDWPEDKPMRVLFTFSCPSCKKRNGVYEDGTHYVSKPSLCPKCGGIVRVVSKRKGRVLTTTTNCSHCDYQDIDVDDFDKSDAEFKAKQVVDEELLKKYRNEFCLSDKEGKEQVEMFDAMEVAHVVHDETRAEFNNPAYERKMQLKKTTITELEAILNKAFADVGFTRLTLNSPQMERSVIVPFTVLDSNSARKERVSIDDLEMTIKSALKDTNWRLQGDHVSYRLGYLSGNLKGYESDEDLLKLAGKEKVEKPKSKLEPEKRKKYENHPYVQIARMSGELEAKENIRKRRLKDEPEGFFFERGEHGYTCGICGESHDSEDIWWRLDGLRCRDCWRNIQEGVIPVLNLDHDIHDEEFIKKLQLEDYGVKSVTARKLRREGLLVGRDLKRSDGSVYYTIYLVAENREFLRKYPQVNKTGEPNFIQGKHGEQIQL